MAIKIRVSNPNFNGFRAGVRFYNGEAVFNDEALGKHLVQEFGYEVVKEADADKTETAPKKPTKKPAVKKGGAE